MKGFKIRYDKRKWEWIEERFMYICNKTCSACASGIVWTHPSSLDQSDYKPYSRDKLMKRYASRAYKRGIYRES